MPAPTDSPSPDPPLQTRTDLLGQVALVCRFATRHSLGETRRFLASKEAPFVVQFAKYGFCGVLALLVHLTVAYAMSQTVFPAFQGLSQADLGRNQIYANLVALAVSNVVAYVTNVWWVFTGGRHHRWIEFLLFSSVNAVSGLAGILAGPFLRQHLGTNWWIAQVSLIVTSTLVNFVCRKFLVFKK